MNKYINRIILAFTVVSFALVASSCGGGNSAEDTTKDPWGWNKGDEDKKDEDTGSESKTYYPKEKGSFRIMSYNIGCFGKYITSVTDNVKMVADMIKEIEADVVTLNELDSINTRHNVNEVALLAEGVGG